MTIPTTPCRDAPLLRNSQRRHGLDVAHAVDDDGPVRAEGLVERAFQITRFFHPDAQRAHGFGDLGEIHRVQLPEFMSLLGLLAAVGAVEEPRLDWLPEALLFTSVTALIFQRTAVSISDR